MKLKKIRLLVEAWKDNKCPYEKKCKKEGKYNKIYDGRILPDCPKRCFEDDYDYLFEISYLVLKKHNTGILK